MKQSIMTRSKYFFSNCVVWCLGKNLLYSVLLLFCTFAACPVSHQTIQTYAPIVKLSSSEVNNPSSVEFFFDNVYLDNDYYVTKQPLASNDDDSLPFFKGQIPGQDSVPVYVHVVPKPNLGDHIYDVVYYFFYPFNKGKTVLGTVYGNHVGDWENFRIRFDGETPVFVNLSEHDSHGEMYRWSDPELLKSGTHPVIYSALGSHALYAKPGSHKYSIIDLVDETDEAGISWDTSENVQIIDYKPIGEYSGVFSWMNFQGRWGNREAGCVPIIGYCVLEDGPMGPSTKDVSNPYSEPDLGEREAYVVNHSTHPITINNSGRYAYFYLKQDIPGHSSDSSGTQTTLYPGQRMVVSVDNCHDAGSIGFTTECVMVMDYSLNDGAWYDAIYKLTGEGTASTEVDYTIRDCFGGGSEVKSCGSTKLSTNPVQIKPVYNLTASSGNPWSRPDLIEFTDK